MDSQLRGMAAIQEALEKAAQREEQTRLDNAAKEHREYLINLLTTQFDKGAAYTNLIILASYAGSFAIWSGTKDQLPKQASISVALLLGVSLIAFISFEIYKMTDGVIRGLKLRRLLETPAASSADFLNRANALAQEQKSGSIKWMIPIWIVQLVISFGTGLAAFGTLLWNYAVILLS
jgi:hypothetical protein